MSARIDFCCPTCKRIAFQAAGAMPTDMRWKCTRSGCSFVGLPVPAAEMPLHRTYMCTTCGRSQSLERPVADRSHCIVCGTKTLTILAETPAPKRAEAYEKPLRGTPLLTPARIPKGVR